MVAWLRLREAVTMHVGGSLNDWGVLSFFLVCHIILGTEIKKRSG